jgi:beta-glucosidase
LPAEQAELASAVAAANPRTVAVLAHGGVLRLAPLAEVVPAILGGALLGQAVGGAVADVLFGAVNPSGRLTETVPVRMEDTAAYLQFPGEHSHVLYGEGIFVGYRWHDARSLDVTYPFGHGLSYTSFGYADLTLASSAEGVTARVTVTNTGAVAGREVVQVYTGLPGSAVSRPPRELKGFASADLAPGESRAVEIALRREDLAYWDRRIDRFVVEGGSYSVSVGASSRDIRLSGDVAVEGDAIRVPLTMNSTLVEAMADPVAGPLLTKEFASLVPQSEPDAAEALGVDLLSLLGSAPVGRMVSFSGGSITRPQLQDLLDRANAATEG